MALSRAPIARIVARVLQGGLLAILVFGLVVGSVSVTVNAVLALLVSLLPAVLRRDAGIHLDTGLALFLTAAVFLHAVGMVGLYDRVWWWDHLTHTLSAMVVAGVAYTVVRAVDEHSEKFHVPRSRLPLVLLLATLAMGLLWEGLELGARVVTDWLGLEVIWVNYGPNDTPLDLVFDAVGALIVSLFGTERLQGTVESVREWLEERVTVE